MQESRSSALLDITTFEVASLFSEDSCKNIDTTIACIDPSLLFSRGPGLDTFGCAAYLDVPHPKATKYYTGTSSGSLSTYFLNSRKLNPLLKSLFPDIYNTICGFFAERFRVQCRLHEIAAVPGFHIYANNQLFRYQASHIPHFDSQYEMLIPLFAPGSNPLDFYRKTLSFTLPVSLPGCESGIRFWDIHYLDTLSTDKASTIGKLTSMKPHTLQYKVGQLVYHSGHLLHQIKAWSANPIDPLRITMQGHGVFVDDQLFLYW